MLVKRSAKITNYCLPIVIVVNGGKSWCTFWYYDNEYLLFKAYRQLKQINGKFRPNYKKNSILREMMKSFTKPKYKFDVYFGVPGSGKTTIAAWLAKDDLKHKRKVYSNVPIKGCYEVDTKDIGVYQIDNGRLIIDEAGIDYNNRDAKKMTPEQIKFFKLHRHYKVNVVCFSQSHEDFDITLRRLATTLYLVKPSLIPFFIKRKRILKKIGINKETHQIEDQYYFQFLGFRYIFSPRLWDMFNSYDCPKLKEKEFLKYE